MVAVVAVDWMIALGVEDVIIMTENTDYGIPAADDEKMRLEAAGIAVEIYSVELGTEDFVPILSRVAGAPRTAGRHPRPGHWRDRFQSQPTNG